MTELRTTVTIGMPESARRLVWETFFVEAGRGIDFLTHLPWYAATDTRCVSLAEAQGETLATAVIRPAPQKGVAMVGFVCVAARARGRGIGRLLMDNVNRAIDETGSRAALLWTSQPAFYEGCGYGVVAQDRFLRISGVATFPEAPLPHVSTWPGTSDLSGLPAFAETAQRLRTDRAEGIVAHGARGATLVDWRGAPVDVLALMQGAGYSEWHVNLCCGDDFQDVLSAQPMIIDESAGPCAMVRYTGGAFGLNHVPVAERI